MSLVQRVSRGRQMEMQVGGVRLGTVNGSAPCSMAAQVISSLSLVGCGLACWTHPGCQDLQAGRESKRSQQGAAEGRADPPASAGRRGAAHPLASSLAPFFAPLDAHGAPTAAQTPKHGCLPPSVSLRQAADPAP